MTVREGKIRYETRGQVALIEMDDGKANAVQSEFCERMQQALDQADRDGAKAIVLTGRPTVFSGGLDLKVLPALTTGELGRTLGIFSRTMERLYLSPIPIVAASSGHALAGGMIIYLTADYRIAVDDGGTSKYGLNEVANGIPFAAWTMALARAGIPPAEHERVIMHARIMDARETLERGITHELVNSREEARSRAFEVAEDLCALERKAYMRAKDLIRRPPLEAARASEPDPSVPPKENKFAHLKR